MSTNTVFTIGRQYGSGGTEIGRRVAKELDIPFYDKELIAISARESGLSESLFTNADEKATSSIFYSLVMGNYPMASGALGVTEMPLNDQLFLIQSKTIKRLAGEGPCVIVGRCADYILRDMDNTLNIFIHADLAYRVERAITMYEAPANKAEDICIKTDKQRANFYNYYSDRKWGRCRTYDLAINSAKLGIEGSALHIIHFDEEWQKSKVR